MKKYLNLAVSAGAAVLALIWLALPCFGEVNGYDLMSLCFEMGKFKYTLLGLITVCLILVAVALLVLAVLNLLVKLNVLKLNLNFAKLTRIVLIVAAALALVYFVLLLTEVSKYAGIGAGTILMLVSYAAAVACNFLVKDAE